MEASHLPHGAAAWGGEHDEAGPEDCPAGYPAQDDLLGSQPVGWNGFNLGTAPTAPEQMEQMHLSDEMWGIIDRSPASSLTTAPFFEHIESYGNVSVGHDILGTSLDDKLMPAVGIYPQSPQEAALGGLPPDDQGAYNALGAQPPFSTDTNVHEMYAEPPGELCTIVDCGEYQGGEVGVGGLSQDMEQMVIGSTEEFEHYPSNPRTPSPTSSASELKNSIGSLSESLHVNVDSAAPAAPAAPINGLKRRKAAVQIDRSATDFSHAYGGEHWLRTCVTPGPAAQADATPLSYPTRLVELDGDFGVTQQEKQDYIGGDEAIVDEGCHACMQPYEYGVVGCGCRFRKYE